MTGKASNKTPERCPRRPMPEIVSVTACARAHVCAVDKCVRTVYSVITSTMSHLLKRRRLPRVHCTTIHMHRGSHHSVFEHVTRVCVAWTCEKLDFRFRVFWMDSINRLFASYIDYAIGWSVQLARIAGLSSYTSYLALFSCQAPVFM